MSENKRGRVAAISVSEEKGTKKTNVSKVRFKKDYGIINDAHAGTPGRQISLLSEGSIEKMKAKGLKVRPGDFAENITTQGLDLLKLKIGTKLKIGEEAVIEISQIGKVCQQRCRIYYQAGDCVMPKEGIFAKVVEDGLVEVGDRLEVIEDAQ